MGKLYRLPRSHSNIWLRLLPVIGICVLALLLAYSVASGRNTSAAALQQGSYGQQVRQLQQELQKQGFYSGQIDGVYGPNTSKAVTLMQQRYGLKADGIAGPQTLLALGLRNTEPAPEQVAGASTGQAQPGPGPEIPSCSLSPDELTLLARAIQAEAEGEPYIGQVAVGAVLLNRVNHVSFPNTLAAVIYQPQALESVANGRINRPAKEESLRAAEDAAAGWDPSFGCLYFWNPEHATSAWIWTREIAVSYGRHVFGI